MKESSRLDPIRHSLAHLLAAAVLKEFPDAKLAIGPTIENGFYYDFELPRSLAPEDLKTFEKTMRGLINKKLPFTGEEVSVAEAKKRFAQQPFKLDLINEFSKEGKALTIYHTGDVFSDLCRGGHVENTSEIPADAFKLDKVAGAYWRGDEKNPMLQRIYGLAFASGKELDEYLAMRTEAEKRHQQKAWPPARPFCVQPAHWQRFSIVPAQRFRRQRPARAVHPGRKRKARLYLCMDTAHGQDRFV